MKPKRLTFHDAPMPLNRVLTRDDTSIGKSPAEQPWPGPTRCVVARLGDDVRCPNCYLAKDPETQEWCVVKDRTPHDPTVSQRLSGGEPGYQQDARRKPNM